MSQLLKLCKLKLNNNKVGVLFIIFKSFEHLIVLQNDFFLIKYLHFKF